MYSHYDPYGQYKKKTHYGLIIFIVIIILSALIFIFFKDDIKSFLDRYNVKVVDNVSSSDDNSLTEPVRDNMIQIVSSMSASSLCGGDLNNCGSYEYIIKLNNKRYWITIEKSTINSYDVLVSGKILANLECKYVGTKCVFYNHSIIVDGNYLVILTSDEASNYLYLNIFDSNLNKIFNNEIATSNMGLGAFSGSYELNNDILNYVTFEPSTTAGYETCIYYKTVINADGTTKNVEVKRNLCQSKR